MRTEVLTIGTEYLTGMVKETDSFYLAGRLAELDAELTGLSIIGDNREEVEKKLKQAFENADMILVTGARGYGKDPAYNEIFAGYFNQEMRFSEEAYTHMKKLAEEKQLHVTDDEIKELAKLPENAQILFNHSGLTCGYILENGAKHLIILPGGSQEIREVFEDDVVGYIYKTTSLGEAELTLELTEAEQNGKTIYTKEVLKEKLAELFAEENPEISLIKNGNSYEIRIHAVGPTKGDASVIAQITAADISRRIGAELIKGMKETK